MMRRPRLPADAQGGRPLRVGSRRGATWLLLDLALAGAFVVGAVSLAEDPPLVRGGHEGQVACAEEAGRLVRALDPIWPGWAATGSAFVSPDAAPESALLSGVVLGGRRDANEALILRRVAGAFRAWSATVLPAPPAFDDVGPRVPETWALQALRSLRQEEARALHAALEAASAKDARHHAAEAARRRFRRVAVMDSAELARLRHDELQQGLGIYTAYQAALLGRHASYQLGEEMRIHDPDFAYAMAPRLREKLIAELAEVAQGRVEYYTPELSGFALALVLDRIRHGWRDDLRDGWRSLDGLLVRQLHPYGPERLRKAPH